MAMAATMPTARKATATLDETSRTIKRPAGTRGQRARERVGEKNEREGRAGGEGRHLRKLGLGHLGRAEILEALLERSSRRGRRILPASRDRDALQGCPVNRDRNRLALVEPSGQN